MGIGGISDSEHSYTLSGSNESKAYQLGQQGKVIPGCSNSSDWVRGNEEYQGANTNSIYDFSGSSPSSTYISSESGDGVGVTFLFIGGVMAVKCLQPNLTELAIGFPIWAAAMYKCHKTDDCFVTTAAYGDGNHPMVQEFRGFRDQVLAKTKTGQAFIDWYYENGPQMAAALDKKPALKAPVRTLLTPLAFTARALRKMNGRELSKK